MPAVWNVAEILEVEYRQPILQRSDNSNSGRKEIEKPVDRNKPKSFAKITRQNWMLKSLVSCQE